MKSIRIHMSTHASICCDLCNPIHLADYETEGVKVVYIADGAIQGYARYFCHDCAKYLALAASGTEIILNMETEVQALFRAATL